MNSGVLKTLVVSLTLLFALFALLAFKGCSEAVSIAAKFRSGEITSTFKESLTKITSTHGNVLELATCDNDESFRREDKRTTGWGHIYLGTTVAQIRVRSTFRYHLLLSDDWNLEVRSNICLVHAPAFRPSFPTAIQTESMERIASSGWARFDKQEQLDMLQSTITPELNRRAGDAVHMDAVREKCRRSVAEFVRNWLLREEQWRTDRFSQVEVIFPDEEAKVTIPWSENKIPILRLGE